MVYKKAIIVEDNDDLRMFFSTALQLEKYETVEFSNGEDALQYLLNCEAKVLPRLALIDFSLGEKSGAELVSNIRATAKTADMRLIMISGWQEVAPLAKKLGADGFLRKPFDFDQLFALLGA